MQTKCHPKMYADIKKSKTIHFYVSSVSKYRSQIKKNHEVKDIRFFMSITNHNNKSELMIKKLGFILLNIED